MSDVTLECVICGALILMPKTQFMEREKTRPVKCNCSDSLAPVRVRNHEKALCSIWKGI